MTLSWTVIDLLVNLVETIVIFKYMGAFFQSKYKNKWVWIALLTVLTFIIFNISEDYKFKLLLYTIIFLFINYLFEGKLIKKIIGWLSLLIIIIGIENLVVVALMALLNQPVAAFYENGQYRLIAIIIAKLLLYLLVVWYANKREGRIIELKIKFSLLMLVIAFYTTIIVVMVLLLKIYETTQINDLNMIALVSSFSVVCVLAIAIYENVLKQAREQMAVNLLNQQKELQYKYLNDLNASVDEMKRVRHDFANHMMCISGYIALKNYTELEKYAQKLSDPLENSSEIVVLGHPVISAMIHSKILVAKKETIHVTLDTDFGTSVNIKDIDLCVLIGNAMDNAIEACLKVEEDKRNIHVRIQTKSDYFLFDSQNPVNMQGIIKENNIFRTNKKDKSIHGIGLRNIQSIVNKYDGEMFFDVINDSFILKITLLNKTNIA